MSWRDWLQLPPLGSPQAPGIDQLHAGILLTTLLGAAVVSVVVVIFTARYRAPPGPSLPTPRVIAPRRLEIAMSLGLVALFSWWWWIGFRQFRVLQTPPADCLDIYVTAKQWMWEFAYDDGRASISVLVVPAGVPVRLLMTSRDVIHGFSVPDFRLKHDVLPGRTNVTWFQANPGIHPIFCTQYCGLEHSRMQGAVVALEPADYAAWHQGQTPELVLTAVASLRRMQPLAAVPRAPAEDLPTQGLAVAARHGCLACHTTDGQRHVGPTWLGLYGTPVLLSDGRTVVADAAYLTESMMDPGAKVVAGFPNTMPSYQGLLAPSESGALVALIASLRPGSPARQLIPPLPPQPASGPPPGPDHPAFGAAAPAAPAAPAPPPPPADGTPP